MPSERSLVARRPLRGFTMIELIMVMLVVGILAAVAAPKYSTAVSQYRADLAARELEADLAYAASEAQRTSQAVTVNFDVTNQRYEMTGVSGADRPGQDFRANMSEAEVTLISADFGGAESVTFDIYGRPTATGSVVLESPGETRTVNVDDAGDTEMQTTTTTN
ncbi:MAG: GspH/FimT family pseudopilin [Lacipirellulaceae bacterium]